MAESLDWFWVKVGLHFSFVPKIDSLVVFLQACRILVGVLDRLLYLFMSDRVIGVNGNQY